MNYLVGVLLLFSCSGSLYSRGAITTMQEEGPNIENKEKLAKALVAKAAAYFSQDSVLLAEACRAFSTDAQWRRGDIFLFILDDQGTCYVYGDDNHIIWQDFSSLHQFRKKPTVDDMMRIADKGGWISFDWNNALQTAYIKTVTKKDKRFIIGAGFFPESSRNTTEDLVRAAADYLLTQGAEPAFVLINSPRGVFVSGDIYLFAYETNGECIAHGENAALVGQNLMNWKDAEGGYRVKNMIEFAQKQSKGWFDYKVNGLRKATYLELVTDPVSKKSYVLGAGYYPDVDDDMVRSFVHKAVSYLKSHGKEETVQAFTGRALRYGGLRVFMLDLEGNILADDEHPEFVGQNLINYHDPDGKYTVRMMLDLIKRSNNGWISYQDKNAYKMVYLEKVIIPGGTYIVGAGYYPESKTLWVRTMVDKATDMMRTHNLDEAFRLFSSNDRDFLRGDIYIFVYDENGYCLVAGPHKDRIWRENLHERKDVKGRNVSDLVVSLASAGGGWIEYEHQFGLRRLYIKGLERENESKDITLYIIGSGYFK